MSDIIEMDADLSNKIYAAIIGYCEELEHSSVYKGNGHHLAQRLVALVMMGITVPEVIYEYKDNKYQLLKQAKLKDGFEWKGCEIYRSKETGDWYVRERADFFTKFKKIEV